MSCPSCGSGATVGDNYGVSCANCGQKLEGYGNWAEGGGPCIHRWLPVYADDGTIAGYVCGFCERESKSNPSLE